MEIQSFPSLPSTNTYIAENAASLPSGFVAVTPCQTAGRGQRGNSWESEPGKNLTFTMLMRMPGFPARRQFRISQAVSLAIIDAIRSLTGVRCTVKWPNDIYAGDRKLCGILISHSLAGPAIAHSVIGAGINVNQTRFLSDAPNPVSISQLTDREHPLEPLLRLVCSNIESYLNTLLPDNPAQEQDIHDRYMRSLWRAGDTPHLFHDNLLDQTFRATIFAVEPQGHLVLRQTDAPEGRAPLRRYAFKEVTWL